MNRPRSRPTYGHTGKGSPVPQPRPPGTASRAGSSWKPQDRQSGSFRLEQTAQRLTSLTFSRFTVSPRSQSFHLFIADFISLLPPGFQGEKSNTPCSVEALERAPWETFPAATVRNTHQRSLWDVMSVTALPRQ
ncbi:uncharacterized protein LOC111928701 isoform X4 [Cyanistes caeruleus]|uniref:uncharacterized protein LOC111928701 isoform X4 n=1 Tax=Cyanistes caeruleus TaxID=156563 RepID=UPI000CDA21D6|nr:uncharacterized protein LOC111928701 isoform X4 [Cyanistes caeruleus]